MENIDEHLERLDRKTEDLGEMLTNQYDTLNMATGVIRKVSDCLKQQKDRIDRLERDVPQVLLICDAHSSTIGTLLERIGNVEKKDAELTETLEKLQGSVLMLGGRLEAFGIVVKNMREELNGLRIRSENRDEVKNDLFGSLWFGILLLSLGWIVLQY